MRRSPSASSLVVVPDWVMQVSLLLHALVNAATAIEVGPRKVVDDGELQLTRKRQRASAFVPRPITYAGEPAGGRVRPSRSEARRPPQLEPVAKHCWVAAA